jgi:hypothetical protein
MGNLARGNASSTANAKRCSEFPAPLVCSGGVFCYLLEYMNRKRVGIIGASDPAKSWCACSCGIRMRKSPR